MEILSKTIKIKLNATKNYSVVYLFLNFHDELLFIKLLHKIQN